MPEIVWDVLEERIVEQGVDHGVLYDFIGGSYTGGVPWNGLTTVTRQPSGAESNKQYADNIVYANLLSAEEWSGTIEAFMAPALFDKFNGIARMSNGLRLGQQKRSSFGFSWRTLKGNAEDPELGYEIHFAWGCLASPSERTDTTKNDSPELATSSFALSTTPIAVPGFKPVAYASVDSTDPTISADALSDLEDVLYGRTGGTPRLPMPAEMNAILGTGVVSVTPAKPAFDDVDEITIPVNAGVDYFVNGEQVADGPLTITEDTVVVAQPAAGHNFSGVYVDRWLYEVA